MCFVQESIVSSLLSRKESTNTRKRHLVNVAHVKRANNEKEHLLAARWGINELTKRDNAAVNRRRRRGVQIEAVYAPGGHQSTAKTEGRRKKIIRRTRGSMRDEVKMDANRLIAEVHKRPALWNQRHISYHNREVTNRVWMEIASIFKLPSQYS